MLGKATGSRSAAGAMIVVAALAAALVGAAPAQAADQERAESPYDTASPKTAVASCPNGQEVIGASGRIKDGDGGVRLSAIIPGQNTVTVRGEAFADHEGAWSVIARAVCAPPSDTLAQAATIESGPSTATCPSGTDLSGAGFDLGGGSVLTGLIPDSIAQTVTVRTPYILIGSAPVAYAICVPEIPLFFTVQFEASSLTNTIAPKTVTTGGTPPENFPPLTGVGGEINWIHHGPGPTVARSDVFIDTLMLNADLTSMTMQAVDRTPPVPTAGRADSAALVADPEDEWSATAYADAPYYYY